jgi:hypothetical protein
MLASTLARRLAAATLVAGISVSSSRAQDVAALPTVPRETSQAVSTGQLPARQPGVNPPASDILLVQTSPADRAVQAGEETSTGIAFSGMAEAAAKGEKATPWSKVPDLDPSPRPGFFLMPPSGSGYYTALDCLKGNCLDAAPAYPYRVVFFDNDFRYLDKIGGQPVDLFDEIKRMHFCDDGTCADRPQGWMLSIGGEERYRLMNEVSSRLTNVDNRYDLVRSRIYGDLWYSDLFRVYVEYIDAQSFNQDLPPLAIDQNHSDLLNAFVDIKLGELDEHPVYGRIGRQEMLYGSQRLMSPLDWANTQRTFEGAKIFWHSDKLDVDGFWVRPEVTWTGRFDSPDANRQVAGLWSTYRPAQGQAIDLYYMYLDFDLKVPFGAAPGGRGGYDLNNFGGRYSGDRNNFLWDFEGSYQFGAWTNRNLSSGFATGGLGYFFKDWPMQPQFWVYYDYASGSPNRLGTGTFSTNNQFFPFGHYYFGYLDLVGRENIHDLNFQAACYPTKWITGLVQYHIFRLDQARDALYGPSSAGSGYQTERFDPTGRAGTNVGQELDLLSNFQLDRHNSVQVGFSKFFSGDFIKQTGPNVNPELFYVQYYFRW